MTGPTSELPARLAQLHATLHAVLDRSTRTQALAALRALILGRSSPTRP